jgi:hypothetical protein
VTSTGVDCVFRFCPQIIKRAFEGHHKPNALLRIIVPFEHQLGDIRRDPPRLILAQFALPLTGDRFVLKCVPLPTSVVEKSKPRSIVMLRVTVCRIRQI